MSIFFAWLLGFLLIIPVVRRTRLEIDGRCGIDWNANAKTENLKPIYKTREAEVQLGDSLSSSESGSDSEYGSYNASDAQDDFAYLYGIAGEENFYELILKNGSEDEMLVIDQFHGRFNYHLIIAV